MIYADRVMRPHVVYRFFDGNGVLLYVGCTHVFGRRIEHHKSTREWFPQVRKITLDWHPDWETAAHAEIEAIARENPRHNKRR